MKVYVFDCIVCKESFEAGRADKIYCSLKCANKSRGQKWRDLNKEKIKRKNFLNNSDAERRILTRVKSRAKQKGIDFNLEIEDVDIPDICPVLGIKLNPHSGHRGYHHDSPSLDKIYPDKGYMKGNVRVISARANLLKNDASVEELTKVLEDLKKLYGETT